MMFAVFWKIRKIVLFIIGQWTMISAEVRSQFNPGLIVCFRTKDMLRHLPPSHLPEKWETTVAVASQ